MFMLHKRKIDENRELVRRREERRAEQSRGEREEGRGEERGEERGERRGEELGKKRGEEKGVVPVCWQVYVYRPIQFLFSCLIS